MVNCFCTTFYPVWYRLLLDSLLSGNSGSFTAARVRYHWTAMICFAQKCNWLCCNVGCHGFRNRQRTI